MCDHTKFTQEKSYKTMKIHSKPKCLSADVKEFIDTPQSPLIKTETEEEKNQHHQGQKAQKPGFRRIRDVRVEDVNIRQHPTRIIPCTNGELQDVDRRNNKYVGFSKNELPTYDVTLRIPTRIL